MGLGHPPSSQTEDPAVTACSPCRGSGFVQSSLPVPIRKNLAAIRGGDDIAGAFHRLFLAATVGVALGLASFLAMAERPLHSGKTRAENGTALE